MRRTVLLSGVVVLLSLLPACGRREGAPTLPQPGPERVHLAFRLVSAQTQNPVAGAKVLVRRAGRDRRAGEGEVLAEATSDGSGWVEVVFERRDAWDPIYLDIDGGPRYLHRYVWLDDTRYEPAPDVRTLWELNPEIGADVCVTYAMIFSCGAGGSNDPGWTCQDCREGRMRLPRGDVYVIVHPEFWSMGVWENFEEAARRMERALRGRWRWRVLRNVWTDDPDRAWPPEVPQDAFIVQVTVLRPEDYPGAFPPPSAPTGGATSPSAGAMRGFWASSFTSSAIRPASAICPGASTGPDVLWLLLRRTLRTLSGGSSGPCGFGGRAFGRPTTNCNRRGKEVCDVSDGMDGAFRFGPPACGGVGGGPVHAYEATRQRADGGGGADSMRPHLHVGVHLAKVLQRCVQHRRGDGARLRAGSRRCVGRNRRAEGGGSRHSTRGRSVRALLRRFGEKRLQLGSRRLADFGGGDEAGAL
jgi:hypothetical protein